MPQLRVGELRPAGGTLPLLLWCVETLEARGWEPVTWELTPAHRNRLGVMMRRVL